MLSSSIKLILCKRQNLDGKVCGIGFGANLAALGAREAEKMGSQFPRTPLPTSLLAINSRHIIKFGGFATSRTFSHVSPSYQIQAHYQLWWLCNIADMAQTSRQLIELREARAEDAVTISELGTHVFTVTFGHSVPQSQLQSYLSEFYSIGAIAKDIGDPLKYMVVASNGDGTIVGFALLTRGTSDPSIAHLESTIELQRIYVDTAYHGNGIGKIMATRVENVAKELGFKHIWLGVWEENHTAQKVYAKLGYRLVGSHPFTIGEVVQVDNIMVKEL